MTITAEAGAAVTESAPALDLESLLADAAVAHGHLCAGQVLGVRMAMFACALLHVTDPRGADRKRLVTFVEIDRCATDAIGVVTGCRLGKRALKFVDWGKMAATFVDLQRACSGDVYAGVRVAALESSKELARARYPHMEKKNEAQMLAYRELSVHGAAGRVRGVRRRRELRARGGAGGHFVVPRVCGTGRPVLPATLL